MTLNNEERKNIYLDYQATTPLDPRVLEVMSPYLKEKFGNPSSQDHAWGWTAKAAAEKARAQVAQLLGCQSSEIFFTSGATESNNWALQGILLNLWKENPRQKIHIVTSSIEHKSVTEPLKYWLSWQKDLFSLEVTWIKPKAHGVISLEEIQKSCTPETKLVSLHWAHNELSTIQDVHNIASWCHDQKIYFHTDATQAVGKVNINLSQTPISLLSFSSHKIYGPKGAGALYIRRKDPYVSIDPILHGGGQERGLRAGTLNVAGLVGLGQACEILAKEMLEENQRFLELRAQLIGGLKQLDSGLKVNSHPEKFLPHAVSITFSKGQSNTWPEKLSRLGLSAGSACNSGEMSGSPNLYQIGLNQEEVQRTLRVSLGRWSTSDEVNQVLTEFSKILTNT